MAAAEQISLVRKLILVRKTLRNWPLVLLDKLGVGSTITYRTRPGIRIQCRTRSTDVNEAVAILSGLEYPPELLRVGDGAVVLDVGANIGAFSLYATSLNPSTAFEIHAFEPYAPNADILRGNLAANLEERVTVVELAIASDDGSAYVDTTGGFDQVRLTSVETPTSVTTSRLSSYCERNGLARIDLLKMDIEGSEYDVLDSDFDWIAAHVARVILEYHDDSSHSRDEAIELLERGFDVEIVHAGATTGVLHARSRDRRRASPARRLGCFR